MEHLGVISDTAEPQEDAEGDVVQLVVLSELEVLELVLQLLIVGRRGFLPMEAVVLQQVGLILEVLHLLLALQLLVLSKVLLPHPLAALQVLRLLLQAVSGLSSLDQFVDYIRNGQLLEPFGATEWLLEVQRGYSSLGSLPLLRLRSTGGLTV